MPSTGSHHFILDQGGSLTVEFVVLAPVLLAALVFSFDLGRVLWAYDVMSRDMRGAERYLARASTDCSTARTAAENFAETGVTSGGTVHFPWTAPPTFSYVSTTFSGSQYSTAGTTIQMTASLSLPVLFISFFNTETGASIAGSIPLSVSVQARCVGN